MTVASRRIVGIAIAPAPVELIELLSHALGDSGARNHYAVEPVEPDSRGWESLVRMKMAIRGWRDIAEGLQLYHVSVPGVAFMRALYPRRFRKSLIGYVVSP